MSLDTSTTMNPQRWHYFLFFVINLDFYGVAILVSLNDKAQAINAMFQEHLSLFPSLVSLIYDASARLAHLKCIGVTFVEPFYFLTSILRYDIAMIS